jgi:excisionase family DNA binding protein
MTNPTQQYLTTGQVARRLGISTAAVWQWCRDGKVESVRTPGGQYRIPAEAIDSIYEAAKP